MNGAAGDGHASRFRFASSAVSDLYVAN